MGGKGGSRSDGALKKGESQGAATHDGSRRPGLRLAAALAALTAVFALVVAPVVGDGLNQQPVPASPLKPPTVLASVPQSSAAGPLPAGVVASGTPASGGRAGVSGAGKVFLKSRITKEPVITEEAKGTFAGISCPKGYKAISGGVISGYINLVISSSSPNNPLTGKYTPQTWWLTVTNANVDGQGGSLSWRGVVNCLAPVALGR